MVLSNGGRYVLLAGLIWANTSVALSGLTGLGEQKSTAEIVAATTAANINSCWRWRVRGICLWLRCRGPFCTVNSSLEVSHYLPDLTVSVFPRSGVLDPAGNSWTEQNALNPTYQGLGDALMSALSGGMPMSAAGMQRSSNNRQRNLHFFEADVIGNPAVTAVADSISDMGASCESEVTSFMPYYISRTDGLEWRFKALQSIDPTTYIDALTGPWIGYDTGSRLTDKPWGYLRPITGMINQEQEHKAAAVIMHRAANLVTRESRGFAAHVFQSVNGSDPQGYWSAEDFKPQSEESGLVQQLSPQTKKTCAAMPPDNDEEDSDGDSLYPIAKSGHYLWNVWRPYTCCKKEGDKLIFYSYKPSY